MERAKENLNVSIAMAAAFSPESARTKEKEKDAKRAKGQVQEVFPGARGIKAKAKALEDPLGVHGAETKVRARRVLPEDAGIVAETITRQIARRAKAKEVPEA